MLGMEDWFARLGIQGSHSVFLCLVCVSVRVGFFGCLSRFAYRVFFCFVFFWLGFAYVFKFFTIPPCFFLYFLVIESSRVSFTLHVYA